MVHRPADSRLLANLLSQEKDYSKNLLTLLDFSHASLASFSAYASASSPPASQVILAVAGLFASADSALRGYATAVDEWREHLKGLKALEDEVATIMRDREILVTRLIKASKVPKPSRDSIHVTPSFPSSSTLSLKSDFVAHAKPFNTTTKLAAAQSELQACENHLASKERELDTRRASAAREGLTIRCRAMMECGWVWSEMGKEGLRALGVLRPDESPHLIPPIPSRPPSPPRPPHSPTMSPPAQNQEQPRSQPDPRPSSDLSSIAPSQSASQINMPIPLPPISVPVSATHIYSDANYLDFGAESSLQSHTSSVAPHQDGLGDAYQSVEKRLTLAPPVAVDADVADPKKHILARRITEEDLTHFPPTDGNSSEEDGPGDVQVIENPRFGGKATSASVPPSSPISPGFGKRFSLRTTTKSDMGAGSSLTMGSSTSVPSLGKRERKVSIFGSIRGLFRGQKGHSVANGSNALIPQQGGGGKWETRTAKNLQGLSGADSDSGDVNAQIPRSKFHTLAEMPIALATPPKARKRLLSDVTEMNSPSQPGERSGGRRLKKGRSTRRPRSASMPPVGLTISKGLAKGPANSDAVPLAMNDTMGGDESGIKRAEEWLDGQGLLAQRQQALDAELDIAERVTERKNSTKSSPDSSDPDKAWASDGGATATGSGSGGASAARRKSKKGNPAILVLNANGNAALAPGSTISTASAPAALSKTSKSKANRRASLGSNLPPTPPLPSHLIGQSSVIVTRRAMSIDDGPDRSPTPLSRSKSKAERRASVPAVHMGGSWPAESKTNLMSIVEGVSKANQEARREGEWIRSHNRDDSLAGMGEVVMAPRSLARDLLDASTHVTDGKDLASIKAPGSVFDIPIVQMKQTVDRTTPTPNYTAEPSPRGQAGNDERVQSQRPKIPLKSALRHASRTPSPMPAVPTAAAAVMGPAFQSLQSLAPVPQSQEAKGTSKALEVHPGDGEDEDEHDDGASISSYETGHEAFEPGAADESSSEDNILTTPPAPPARVTDFISTASDSPAQSDRTMTLNRAPSSHITPAHSDVSASTESSHPQSTVGQHRRKSVRVSLQPTFSPTPPAIDDDDETVDRAPWGGKTNGEAGRDMWEDSSDEEAEYSKAKRLLTRAAKKEKKVW